MGLLQLFAILWARRVVVLSCFAATVALAIGVTLILPKSYEAKVLVLVDHDTRDPYTNEFQGRSALAEALGKQVAIIKSDRTAHQVIDDLHLTENPRFKRDFARSTGGKGQLSDWIARKLVKTLRIMPNPPESSIEIRYNSPDPDTAATVANAFADAYMRTNLEIRVQSARDTSARLQEQARTLQKELSDAEKRLHDYQQRTGLIQAENDLDSETKQLEALTKLQIDTTAHTEALSAQLKAFQDAKANNSPIDQLDGVADNQLLQQLRQQIAILNGELAQIRGKYGPGHPDYTSGLARRRALESEIASEIERIGGALAAAVRAGQQKTAEIEKAIKEQKDRVTALQSNWGELQVYLNEVKTKRGQLAQTFQRAGEESIQSRVSDVAALVLTPASPPTRPQFPNLLLNSALAVAFGLVFGLAMAVLVELADRRIRSADDVEDAAGAPVIVVLPKRA